MSIRPREKDRAVLLEMLIEDDAQMRAATAARYTAKRMYGFPRVIQRGSLLLMSQACRVELPTDFGNAHRTNSNTLRHETRDHLQTSP